MTNAEDDQQQIALHRNHAIGFSDLLTRVEKRGGARTPCVVDVATVYLPIILTSFGADLTNSLLLPVANIFRVLSFQ